MTVKQRIKSFIEYKQISDRQFALSIDVSAGYINSISKSIQPDKLSRISALYPELNTTWLLTGEGEMIKDGQQTTKQETTLDLSKLISTIESQQETINRQSKIIEMLTGKI